MDILGEIRDPEQDARLSTVVFKTVSSDRGQVIIQMKYFFNVFPPVTNSLQSCTDTTTWLRERMDNVLPDKSHKETSPINNDNLIEAVVTAKTTTDKSWMRASKTLSKNRHVHFRQEMYPVGHDDNVFPVMGEVCPVGSGILEVPPNINGEAHPSSTHLHFAKRKSPANTQTSGATGTQT